MKKVLKWLAIVIGVIVLICFAGFQYMMYSTKKHSPQETVIYQADGYDIEIEYCRPYKKDREIFGGLVPYGEVWRTGANEPTQFITKSDLKIEGEVLPAGTYTLWTIPGSKEWEVIFNKGAYDWGVDWDNKAMRDPALDVISTTVQKLRNFKVLEQFTIDIKPNPELPDAPAILMIGWDYTRADVVLNR